MKLDSLLLSCCFKIYLVFMNLLDNVCSCTLLYALYYNYYVTL